MLSRLFDLPNTIGRTLTEDLPIGDRAAATGLRVLTRQSHPAIDTARAAILPVCGGSDDANTS